MLTVAKRRTAAKPKPTVPRYGPSANGRLMSPREFDRGDFERDWSDDPSNA